MNINLAYTVDVQGPGAGQFVDQLLCSVYSARKHRREEDSITCYVAYGNMPVELMRKLVALQTDRFRFEFFNITQPDMNYMQQFTRHNPASQARPWCGIVYARLFLPKFFPELDRVLYLDSDTMIVGSLHELYSIDLGDKLFGMNMGIVPEYGFNSGVMLMDLRKMREDVDLYPKLDGFMRTFSASFFLPDQTTINRFFADRILPIDRKYNFPPTPGMRNPEMRNATILHFYNQHMKPMRVPQDDVGMTNVLWNNELADAEAEVANRRTEKKEEPAPEQKPESEVSEEG